MNIITLVEPTQEPVTLAEVYEHLRLTPDPGSPPTHPDDDMLTRQIKVAREDCENQTRRAFVKQKLRLVVDPQSRWWPWEWEWNRGYRDRRHGRHCFVELKKPPIAEVLEVSYYDQSNALTIVDPANYFATDDEPARLQFLNGFAVSAYARADALRIDYWAGYPFNDSPEDLVGSVPETIKAAILIGVELQYDSVSPQQRDALAAQQKAMLSKYVVQIAI